MRSLLFVLICSVGAPSFAQLSLPNSSFLLEEGWRADSGVNQHAIAYGDRRWSYTWSQEFAAPARPHRFGWSASVQATDSVSQLGDLSLDYVWQLKGTDADRIAVAPHLSFVTPLQGGEDRNAVVVASLPLSMRHGARAATHWNVRAAWTAALHEPFELVVAAGLVRLIGDRMAAVVETEFRPLDREVTISAGARWNPARSSGSGIVPGIAVPMTISRDDRSVSVLFHVMFEHQLSRSGSEKAPHRRHPPFPP